MSTDYEALDREIIEALRSDAVQRVPDAARQRVALRLASAGAVGLAASVAGVTQAAATTSVVVTSGVTSAAVSGAVASAASAAGAAGAGAGVSATGSALASLTFVGLAKTLAVGLGLGAGVGLGLHVAFRGAPRTETHVVAARATAREDASAAPRRAGERAHSMNPARAEASPNADPSPNAASNGDRTPAYDEAKRPPAALAVRARAALSSDPPVNPGPELPEAPASAQGLAEQQRLLERARAALGRGDARAALGFVTEHTRTFPRTAFEEERELLCIKALVALGRQSEASAQAAAFQARFPRSVFLPSLRSAVGEPLP